MKIEILEGEGWPIFNIQRSDHPEALDIPDKTYKKWCRVTREWERMQDELNKLYEEQE